MEVVRDEFVVSLELVVGDVEEKRALGAVGALANDLDGSLMSFEQRRNALGDERFANDLAERAR
jgi:hypothetical protein